MQKIDELSLTTSVINAQKALLEAENNLITTENNLFKAKLPDFTTLNAPEGTTTVDDGALKFESLLLAKVATKGAVAKLLSGEYLAKNLITEPGNRIYLYSGSENESARFFQYYQQYDYFNIQYNSFKKEYAGINVTPKIELLEPTAYLSSLRGIETRTFSALGINNVPTIIGTLIEAKKLFNINRTFEDLEATVELDMLIGEVYQQFNNSDRNEIYYPKLQSLEKKGVDTVIEKVVELIYLQQTGVAKLADANTSPESKEKITALNSAVTAFLNGSGIASEGNAAAAIGVVGNDAIPTITQLAKGYSVHQSINPQNRQSVEAEDDQSNEKKKVFLLYLQPTFGGNFIDSKSLFSSSKKVSGGLIIDYQLYQVGDENGLSRIINAGSVDYYISPQKVDDNLAESIREIGN